MYHDICYNGTEWWFLDPHVKQMRPEAVTFTGQKDMVDGYLVPSGPVIKPEEQLLPFNSGMLCAGSSARRNPVPSVSV